MKQIFAIITVFFVLTAFSINSEPVVDGNTLPAVDVKTMDGKSINIQELVGKGKITVISFWATWCSPCKRELDAIADIYPDWQEEFGVELLAVTIDDARGVAKVPAMVASKGWEYRILSDSKQELQRALNFQTVPQTFLLNGAGEIIYTHSGYSPGDEFELEEQIKKAAGI
jgi:peroxiredoxin